MSQDYVASQQLNDSSSDWRALYDFPCQRFSVGDAGAMNYVDTGSGSPILMVHGNPTWSFYYHRLISGLQHKARCLAVDHLGCGLSDKPQRYRYCLDQHIENLVGLVKELDLQNITLVAHDWGGAIGMGVVRHLPQRFARIVLLNTAAFPPPFFPWRIRICRTPGLGTWAMRRWNVFARAALTMATERPDGLTPADRAGLLAPYDSWENRVAIDRFVHDIPTRPSQATWKTLSAIEKFMPTLNRPVKLIWGMKDWCFRPECLDRFINIWPHAEVLRLPNAGHYVMLDQPEQVVSAVEQFLGS